MCPNQQQHERKGWYLHPSANAWLSVANKTGTDKVWIHNYQTMYGKLFEMPARRDSVKKFLEIGLGCDMAYGPGRSATLWRRYFPDAEIWMAEYAAACVAQHAPKLAELRIQPLVGDQANTTTLREWVAQSGGCFDFIVDDGGHSNMQQYTTFQVLFEHALKPGGFMVVEDLLVARSKKFVDGDQRHVMIEVIKDWVEALVMNPHGAWTGGRVSRPYRPRHRLPRHLKSIECFTHACVFVKCFEDDAWCYSQTSDAEPEEAAAAAVAAGAEQVGGA